MSVWKGSVIKLIYHNVFLFLIPYTLLREAVSSSSNQNGAETSIRPMTEQHEVQLTQPLN